MIFLFLTDSRAQCEENVTRRTTLRARELDPYFYLASLILFTEIPSIFAS